MDLESQGKARAMRRAAVREGVYTQMARRASRSGRAAPDQEEIMSGTKITIRNNGSIRIEGDFTLYDHEGRAFDLAGRTQISLCRCGQSSNKPFCDSTHMECGFSSSVEARALPPPAPKPV
jgi:CDGSH-type Zn-finger protein